MTKINLIPEVKLQQQKVRQVNLIVTTVCFVVGAVVVGAIVLLSVYFIARKGQMIAIESGITQTNNELKAYDSLEKTVYNLESGLKEISKLANSDSKWDKLFTELEKATPNDIRFASLTVSPDNSITLSVEGASVKSIDRFIKSFTNYKKNEKTLFTNVQVDGYTVKDGNGKVSFQAKLNLDEGVLNGS